MIPRIGAALFALSALAWSVAGAVHLYRLVTFEPPPSQADVRLVRMLDVTVNGMQDRNTTNRRQRFECVPAQ